MLPFETAPFFCKHPVYVVHARQAPVCNILSKLPASISHVLLIFRR